MVVSSLRCMNDPQPEGRMASHIERRKFLAARRGGGVPGWGARAAGRAGAGACRGHNADTDPEGRAWFSAFRQGLQDLGWVEGRNFRADYRWPAGDLDRMRVIAKEFIDLQPDVLVAGNTPAGVSLFQETRKIRIVVTLLDTPV